MPPNRQRKKVTRGKLNIKQKQTPTTLKGLCYRVFCHHNKRNCVQKIVVTVGDRILLTLNQQQGRWKFVTQKRVSAAHAREQPKGAHGTLVYTRDIVFRNWFHFSLQLTSDLSHIMYQTCRCMAMTDQDCKALVKNIPSLDIHGKVLIMAERGKKAKNNVVYDGRVTKMCLEKATLMPFQLVNLKSAYNHMLNQRRLLVTPRRKGKGVVRRKRQLRSQARAHTHT
jgi:hypothetical protein